MCERLKVIEYFDSLVNEVDLKAEKLLIKYSASFNDENDPHDDKRLELLINQRRNSFVERIESLKTHNLNVLSTKFERNGNQSINDEYSIFDKCCYIFDKFDMHFQRPKFKDEFDSLAQSDELDINETFGVLVILDDGRLSERNEALFKELVYYGNNAQNYPHNQTEHGNKFYIQYLYGPSHLMESNIFNAKINDVLIKQEAIKLFFRSPVTINIKQSIYDDDIDSLVNYLKWFESNLDVKQTNLTLVNDKNIELAKFSGLARLETLSMYRNEKNFSAKDFTSGLPNLKRLKIIKSLNYFEEHINIAIEISSFSSLTSLQELILVENSIETIEPGAFDCLNNLKKLDLSLNQIKSIESYHFRNLTNLIELNISKNRITCLDDKAFSDLHNLKILYLNGLMVESINEMLFKSLSRLETLQISSETIRIIHQKAFETLENLQNLTFTFGSLEFDEKLISGLSNLKYLNVFYTHGINFKLIQTLSHLEELALYKTLVQQPKASDLHVLINLKKLKLTADDHEWLDEGTFRSFSLLEELEISQMIHLTEFKLHAFEGLHNLTKLKISCNCKFRKLAPDLFEDLTNLSELILNRNQLISVEPNLFDKLTHLRRLDLSCNEIVRIYPQTFVHLTNLEYLLLDHNKLAQLDENSFAGLYNLRLLNLSFNKLTHLLPKLFNGLINLNMLYLVNNQLDLLDSMWFYGLWKLKILRINYNKLTGIEYKTFQYVPNLLELNLAKNQIQHLSDASLFGLKNLLVLNFFGNKIESISERLFNHMINVRELTLSQNGITQIDDNAFDTLVNLNSLSLAANKLDKLNASIFKNLSKLTSLMVNQNKLSKIQSGMFDSLINLKILDLSQNLIESIEDQSMDRMTKLTDFDLKLNQFKEIDCSHFEKLQVLSKLTVDRELIDQKKLINLHLVKCTPTASF